MTPILESTLIWSARAVITALVLAALAAISIITMVSEPIAADLGAQVEASE